MASRTFGTLSFYRGKCPARSEAWARRFQREHANYEHGAVLIHLLADKPDDLAGAARSRGARIIELRFFSGLTIDETAEVLDVSAGTVKREWSAARAWLYREVRATIAEG